jgi:uncharacterized SAM-binding protein YcdF (DUF218 family)
MINIDTINLARILWEYQNLGQGLKKSDCIIVLGSHDLRVADWTAELFHKKWSELIIFSGGLGNFTLGYWDEPEADIFAKRAISLGVPEKNILIENKSSNTGENVRFSRELLKRKNIDPESFILVQKPYMERRTLATFKNEWPEKEDFVVSSPQLSFENYCTEEINIELLINILVGDLQRIIEYPARGFQIYQKVPEYVLKAYNALIKLGFTNHML